MTRKEKLNSKKAEVPIKTNNYFTCKPTCVKSTNTPIPVSRRDVEEVKCIVNGEITAPSKKISQKDIEARKFIPIIDVMKSKVIKKKS